ncbi:unnamed protein product [Rotaria sp. Silwood2]|nr:unnamed protein product [Rotaria sp. Silwood2]CAF3034519.1 unnamed protein product [Rotaria sp. Silwood2]CAF3070405.1 unnamed protein product [Rotaria sp. Silwood2]CAF4269270.1 unnamed protein product [Rotaria sp. Silwood2]CAF4549650.1 unnamed protein product [Rotaria sp. Silwood2]
MGNDTRFIEAEDLPFRLIDIPVGSAPSPPSSPTIRKSQTINKRHAPPIPPPRVDGYDVSPSLLPPPVVPKRFDQPVIRVLPRSDLLQSHSNNITTQYSSNKINCHRKKVHKPKLACCIIS